MAAGCDGCIGIVDADTVVRRGRGHGQLHLAGGNGETVWGDRSVRRPLVSGRLRGSGRRRAAGHRPGLRRGSIGLGTLAGSWWLNRPDAAAAPSIRIGCAGGIRKHAPKTIPLVGGLGFATDYSEAGDPPFQSPDIALTAHPYPGIARTDRREVWDAMFGHLAERYPFVFTEAGFDPYDVIVPQSYPGALDYGRELMQYAEEKQISWAAFVVYNGPGWPSIRETTARVSTA